MFRCRPAHEGQQQRRVCRLSAHAVPHQLPPNPIGSRLPEYGTFRRYAPASASGVRSACACMVRGQAGPASAPSGTGVQRAEPVTTHARRQAAVGREPYAMNQVVRTSHTSFRVHGLILTVPPEMKKTKNIPGQQGRTHQTRRAPVKWPFQRWGTGMQHYSRFSRRQAGTLSCRGMCAEDVSRKTSARPPLRQMFDRIMPRRYATAAQPHVPCRTS